MKFIHSRRYLNEGEVVQLDCGRQCNLMLMTDEDFLAYQNIRQFRYCGGSANICPPGSPSRRATTGIWSST